MIISKKKWKALNERVRALERPLERWDSDIKKIFPCAKRQLHILGDAYSIDVEDIIRSISALFEYIGIEYSEKKVSEPQIIKKKKNRKEVSK